MSVFRVVPGRLRLTAVRALADAALGDPDARSGVRELAEAEDAVMGRLDQCAVRYEGGIHPKHRLMRYHDFFVARITAGERILDVGCGDGSVAHSLALAGALVTGIDLDERNIGKAKQRYRHPALEFVCGDARADLPKGRFETVVLSNVLEHIDRRQEFLRQLRGIPGVGRFLVRVPLVDRHWLVPLRQELGLPHYGDPTHHTEYTLESFGEEMRQAGLVVAHAETRWGEIWAEIHL